ncbi:MAG: extracellular solute-binding protein family 5 [Thermomicrobiales bacterium]|nr:extracellular solute-binding protein family 5 [Thermomicrobiales bacterium]
MTIERFEDLARLFRQNRLDRRRLLQTASALGLSASAVGGTLSRVAPTEAFAQESDLKLVTISHQNPPTWVRNFNPFFSPDEIIWPSQAGIYEPMLIYNTATAELVPWLATEWEFNTDNTALTFTLREGVNWSDGEPFTSKDVKYTFDLLMGNDGLPGTEGVRGVLPFIASVEAPDDRTVVVNFSQVFTPGIYEIGEQMIVPEHIWKDVEDPITFQNENPVGTGPFTEIGTFQPQYYEIHKNPNYWQEGKPFIDGFRAPVYPNNDAANLAMVSGEVDMASNFIPDIENVYVAKNPEHFGYWFPAVSSSVHLYTNTTRAPFDDPNVRKALSMAIDRNQIVTVAMFDYTHPSDATGLGDDADSWRSEEAVAAGTWTTRDVAKANELLDAAGLTREGDTRVLPDGTPMSYDLNVVSGWSDWVATCQIMAQNLEEVGITAAVKTYDFAAFYDILQKGDFDLSIWSGQVGPTPYTYYRNSMSSLMVVPVGELASQNFHRYSNSDADALLEQFASSGDSVEQHEIVDQLQMIYVENAPLIPLFPGPTWGEYNTMRFIDFPTAENPYVILAGYQNPDRLIQITTIKPRPE